MPRNSLILENLLPRLILVSCAAGLVSGCAKFPSNQGSSLGSQLVITMTVAGQINPSDYYFVVFNNANSTNGANGGPEPITAAPWLNGFVTGSATQFVEYTGSNPGDGYIVQDLTTQSGGQLSTGQVLSAPVSDTPVVSGQNYIQFRIPLAELATPAVPAGSINNLQINFINTDTLPVNSEDVDAKHDFDALGNPFASELNDYITINTTQNTTYSNSTNGNLEPQGDVAACTGGSYVADTDQDAPNLDITNWSVQITQ